MSDHSSVENIIWQGTGYTLILPKNTTMGYNTLDEFAEAIVKAGGGKELILKSLRAVHSQGYSAGYGDCTNDIRKAKQSKRKVTDDAFKDEMDKIDDVMKDKWS